MALLFWLLWLLNLLLTVFIVIAKGLRSSFTSNDPTAWVTVLFVGCLIGSLLLRYMFRQETWGLVVVLLPFALLLGWYLFDKLLG